MNYTEEQRREIYDLYGYVNIPVDIRRKIVQDCDELERELTALREKLAASRDSRQLSAVPSELLMELHEIKHIEKRGGLRVIRVQSGWIYRFSDDQNVFVPERGIAG